MPSAEMIDPTPPPGEASVGRVPLAWWLRLRWGALVALALAAVAGERLGMASLPTWAFVALSAALILSNATLTRLSGGGLPITPALMGGVLLADTLMLTGFLYLTGGPSNPFSVLYLVQVTLAVVVLPSRWTWGLVAASVMAFGALFLLPPADMPVDPHAGHAGHGGGGAFDAHLQGMWWAFALAAVLIAWLVGRVQRELRARAQQVAEMQDLAARNERLAGLTTLSAGAAHELGTPLGTVAVVARELEREAEAGRLDQAAIIGDARLIRAEIDRCRHILDQMGERAGESVAEAPRAVSIPQLEAQMRSRLSESADAALRFEAATGLGSVYVQPRALAQVLSGLVNNAVQASPPGERVTLRLSPRGEALECQVVDQGQGMDAATLRRAGEPFFTTKAQGDGMGLGLFLARLFAQRVGGKLELESNPGVGTTATLTLPGAMGGGARGNASPAMGDANG